MVLLKK